MAAGPLAGMSQEEWQKLQDAYEPYRPGRTYASSASSGLTAAPPANPLDRVRNAVTDSDYFRRLSPEAQRVITGSANVAELLPPVAAARGGYDVGAGAASSDVGRTVEGALNAVPDVGPAAKTAMFVPVGYFDKLAAKSMLKRGASLEDIWHDKGVMPLPEKKWVKEIDDRGLLLTQNANPAYGHILHADLTKAEPSLAKTDVSYWNGPPDKGGAYFTGSNPPNIAVNLNADPSLGGSRSIAAHELQHAIQNKYGWSPGGSPADNPSTRLAQQYVQDAQTGLVRGGAKPATVAAITPGQMTYLGSSGEDLAKNVQHRLDWDPQQRRDNPPWQTSELAQTGFPRLLYEGDRTGLRKGAAFDEQLAQLWNIYGAPGAQGWGP